MKWREEHIGDCRLILGDCLEVLPTLPKVDSVVTDPPYGVGLKAKQHKWFRRDGAGYASTEDTVEMVRAVAVPVVRQCISMARSVSVTPGTECAWFYPKPDDIGTIFNSSGTGSGRWGFKCSTPVLFYGKCPYLATGQGRRANSWRQPENDYAEQVDHPCPKPLGMMQWLVTRVSLPNETVLDPFMGSGTTLVACAKLGRKGIGIEIEPKYFDIACRRVEEAYRQPRLDLPEPLKPEQVPMEGI